jgi:hypothetical protein
MTFSIDAKALVRQTPLELKNESLAERAGLALPGPNGNFSRVFNDTQLNLRVKSSTLTGMEGVTVKAGDTLTGIVKNYFVARGIQVNQSDALRMAQDVARASGIANPDRIFPGQRLNTQPLQAALAPSAVVAHAPAAPQPPASVIPMVSNSPLNMEELSTASMAQVQLLTRIDSQANPVLQKTLDRAVDKGFIPASERQAVHDRILQLASEYKFAPDDFARLTLMESDGMNPKASNNRCHGIIQFCDGPDRGAASVGYGSNPKAILKQSVLQQLDMVAKYFDDTGLKGMGGAGLDDLYLTVLTPAARQETRPNVSLNIAGTQASHLYVNKDPRSVITRASLLQGLHQNANERLGLENKPASLTRAQLVKVSAYQTPLPTAVR